MHILFIGPFPWPSTQGSQAYLAAQAQAIAARGHRVNLAVYGGGTGGEIAGVELLRGSPSARFTTGGMHWSRPLADLGIVRRIRALHRAHPVDVVHAHQVEGPMIARAARLGVPIVYDLHTSMEEELHHHLPMLPYLAPRVGRGVDRLALSCADGGCAISARAAAIFQDRGLPHRQVGPAVDPQDFEGHPPDATPRIVYTGNLDAYQDLDLLLHTELPLPLHIVTGSHTALPSHVQVLRSPDPKRALAALAGATVAVIPRRQMAGFPIKLLNHLGMGVPTLMMKSAGIAVPGAVLTTPERFLDDLTALIHDAPRRRRLGADGARWVRSVCTPSARSLALEQLYDQMLGRPATSPT